MSIILDIEKQLGKFRLKVNLEAGNEVLSLLGASGCGKSMTLKCIAGIEKPDRGRIIVDDTVLFDSERHINLSPQQRRTGLMFQNYALFPNMSVRKNILAGTRRDKDKAMGEKKTQDIMERFGLTEHAEHLPSQLSGGQQQRVALARILVSEPQILLLDEPFSALDSHLRFRMEQEVREVMRSFGRTVILVSHNRDEVFRLSDRIAVMIDGHVDVSGSKEEVFADPQTRNAAILTGCKNISPIRKIDEHHLVATDWEMELETQSEIGDASYIGIRHHYTNDNVFVGEDSSQSIDTTSAVQQTTEAAQQTTAAELQPNIFRCEVAEVIENLFTFTVMMRIEGRNSASLFGWELDKAEWKKIQASHLTVHVPDKSILLLRE